MSKLQLNLEKIYTDLKPWEIHLLVKRIELYSVPMLIFQVLPFFKPI
jgi:hypothetical protein